MLWLRNKEKEMRHGDKEHKEIERRLDEHDKELEELAERVRLLEIESELYSPS